MNTPLSQIAQSSEESVARFVVAPPGWPAATTARVSGRMPRRLRAQHRYLTSMFSA